MNLNCVKYSSLSKGRKEALEVIQTQIDFTAEVNDIISECKYWLNIFETETDPKTPYCGIIIWWLRDYIKALEVSTI